MIIGVVLAAGAGTRIGYPKVLLTTSRPGETFVQRACSTLRAAGIDDIVVVLAGETVGVVERLQPSVRLLTNPDPSRGQLSSLHVALRELPARAQAIVALPVDVPLVTADTVLALIARWRATRAPIVRPSQAERHGHPVIFDRAVFRDLLDAPLSEGAKPVVRQHASAAGDVACDDEGAFTDVDTIDDYVSLFGRRPGTD